MTLPNILRPHSSHSKLKLLHVEAKKSLVTVVIAQTLTLNLAVQHPARMSLRHNVHFSLATNTCLLELQQALRQWTQGNTLIRLLHSTLPNASHCQDLRHVTRPQRRRHLQPDLATLCARCFVVPPQRLRHPLLPHSLVQTLKQGPLKLSPPASCDLHLHSGLVVALEGRPHQLRQQPPLLNPLTLYTHCLTLNLAQCPLTVTLEPNSGSLLMMMTISLLGLDHLRSDRDNKEI